MLTWFLHDLQIWKPRSYRNGAYARVLHGAGSPGEFAQARFVERSGTFFSPELQWLYDGLIRANSIAAVFNDDSLMTRIRQAAGRPLALNRRAKGRRSRLAAAFQSGWSWTRRHLLTD